MTDCTCHGCGIATRPVDSVEIQLPRAVVGPMGERESHTHQTPMGPIIIYGKPSNLDGYILGYQLMLYDQEQARQRRANRPWWRFW